MVTLSDAVDDTRGRVLCPLEAVQLPIVQTTGVGMNGVVKQSKA